MSALTRSSSGRAVLVALAIGLIGAMMAIAIFPAEAAVVGKVGRVSGDACQTLGIQGESFAFDVPKGDPNDQTRVFDETYGLDHGVSLEVFLPSNRSYLNFDMSDGSVSAVVLFGRNNQRNGTLYDYRGGSPVVDDDGLESLYNGNIKSVTLCYGPKASPSISTSVSKATAAIGDAIFDTATLSDDFDATGDITFSVYDGLASCESDNPLEGWPKTVAVDDNGEAVSPNFTPSERGTYYWVASYAGDSFNDPTRGSCGDAGEVSTVFDNSFVCDEPVTVGDLPMGLGATFIRFGTSEECGDPKFGNINFSVDLLGDDVIQFAPDLDGDANFVGELTFDTEGAAWPDILQIDDTLNEIDDFDDMEWYETLDSINYDGGGVISGADFTCPTPGKWCILSATVDRDQVVWVIGGPDVDPRFR